MACTVEEQCISKWGNKEAPPLSPWSNISNKGFMVAASFVPLPKLCDVCCACVALWIVGVVCVIDWLQQQLAAYVSWVNSQLKRKPGLKPVRDLRHDLQDGVVLVQLIEIVGKYSYYSH